MAARESDIDYHFGGVRPKYCDSPVLIPSNEKLPGKNGKAWAPCGRCPSCLRTRRSTWYSRLLAEHACHDYTYFVTLTYKDEFLLYNAADPHTGEICQIRGLQSACGTEYDLFPQPVVSRMDVQNFLKRLRNYAARDYLRIYEKVRRYERWHSKMLDYNAGLRKSPPAGAAPSHPGVFTKGSYPKLRYYLISEYGPTTRRPHYHLLLFGWPEELDIYTAINECWLFGEINTATSCTDAQIMYVANYHLDRFVCPDGVEPNFCLMSSKPGIGHLYSSPFWQHPTSIDDGSPYFRLTYGGRRLPLGRYLRKKIFGDQDIPMPDIPDNGLTFEDTAARSFAKESVRRRKSKKYI